MSVKRGSPSAPARFALFRRIIVVGEAVDPDDPLTVAQQAVDETRADEAGRSGHDDVIH